MVVTVSLSLVLLLKFATLVLKLFLRKFVFELAGQLVDVRCFAK